MAMCLALDISKLYMGTLFAILLVHPLSQLPLETDDGPSVQMRLWRPTRSGHLPKITYPTSGGAGI
jgi:hypothetical protein